MRLSHSSPSALCDPDKSPPRRGVISSTPPAKYACPASTRRLEVRTRPARRPPSTTPRSSSGRDWKARWPRYRYRGNEAGMLVGAARRTSGPSVFSAHIGPDTAVSRGSGPVSPPMRVAPVAEAACAARSAVRRAPSRVGYDCDVRSACGGMAAGLACAPRPPAVAAAESHCTQNRRGNSRCRWEV